MPQFKIIPSREKILARIPNYAVDIEPIKKSVTVSYNGTVIAESDAALLIRETKHADVVYLPRSAMKSEYFVPTDHTTYCPFKGNANYWRLSMNGVTEDNIVWSYETPYEEVTPLKDYISFYPDRTETTLTA
ncbi:MAG: hypothetical protein ACJAYE_001346 [Candidatus Azotimanducaceae bacterium]|jgi:uncharacterized protein (DUF427 family)